MKVIAPITVSDAILTDSNVAENDAPAWGNATPYALGAQVMSLTSHRVFQSAVADNLGNDPETDAVNWFPVGATNRWKAFDLTIQDQVQNAGTITYTITTDSLVTGIAFLGLDAAQVRVQIAAAGYDKTISLVDDSEVVDWFTFFTWDAEEYDTEALFTGLPGYAGNQIVITIGDGSGTARVGQIVLGKVIELGTTLDGATIGIADFSIKEQDAFGNLSLVERGFADETEFPFTLPTTDARRVKRALAKLRATPALYFAGEDLTRYGATVFGFYEDFEIPLSSGGTSFANLTIKGLV